jgi:hypothetical protein
MLPKMSTAANVSLQLHILEWELVGAFPTSGQLNDPPSASLIYHMEAGSVFAALPGHSQTGLPFSFLLDLTFKLRVLFAMGAILRGSHVRSNFHRRAPNNDVRNIVTYQ